MGWRPSQASVFPFAQPDTNESLRMKRFLGLRWAAVVLLTLFLALFGAIRLFGGTASSASAATTAQQIGMKVLLITDSANANATIAYGDWENTLQREGVPYTSVVTNSTSPGSVPLPTLSSTSADGTQVANYEGVIVTVSGALGLTAAQWTQLQTFEHQFSIRQVTAYVVPSSDYGLNTDPTGGCSTIAATGVPTCAPAVSTPTLTADGSTVFPYLNKVSLDPGPQSTWVYQATPLASLPAGASVDTLLSGPNGGSLLGIYTSPDGRQTMYQTFNENQYYLQSQLLRHGELDWVTRNTYFGDQRNYLEMDIDDTFTPDDVWDTATHSIDYSDADAMRMNPADVATASTWEANHNFRTDQLFNMGGSVTFAADCADGSQTAGCNGTTDTDPLLAAFQATCTSNCGPGNAGAGKPYADSFGWTSHTYDTPYLDVGCATQNYIEAELNENTNVAHEAIGSTAGTGGLALTETTDPSLSLGYEDGQVFVPGNHSGFADLVPGNPATVDPPIIDDDLTAQSATGGALPAGTYQYAVTDQFTNSATPNTESAAGLSALIDVTTGTTNTITINWQAICHAADYVIYRGYNPAQNATTATAGWTWTRMAPATGSAYGAVSTPFSATLPDTSSGNPASTTDVSGGGELEQSYMDTGAAGTATTEPSTSAENAVETPWEQNPYFAPALAAVGITAVGDDGSKTYPDPADTQFGIGVNYTGATYPAGSTFVVPGTSAQVVPRHPVNIYYNAGTDAQELDEYQTLYPAGSSACPTTCTFRDVITQVVSGLFSTMMNNDPRPSYVHQTNIIGTPPAGSEESPDLLPPASYTPPATCTAGAPCTTGDGTLYQALDPLLYQYNQYFKSNAPIEQLTEQAIANLLAEQQAWSASSAVSGYVEGNTVTVDNGGAAIEVPLTGIENVGSAYAGTQSGWTEAPLGTSTYTALAAWPAEPTNPVTVTTPSGPAPGGTAASGGKPTTPAQPAQPAPASRTPTLYYEAVQVAPKTVSIKNGDVTVSLKCEAKNGKPAKNHFCTGTFSLKVMGKTVSHSFRIKATKIARISIKLPKKALAAAAAAAAHTHKHPATMHAALVISTRQPQGPAKLTRGTLNVKT
jgi:hypothetical protein